LLAVDRKFVEAEFGADFHADSLRELFSGAVNFSLLCDSARGTSLSANLHNLVFLVGEGDLALVDVIDVRVGVVFKVLALVIAGAVDVATLEQEDAAVFTKGHLLEVEVVSVVSTWAVDLSLNLSVLFRAFNNIVITIIVDLVSH